MKDQTAAEKWYNIQNTRKDRIMAKDFAFVPFKREDHIYHNEAFAELCKDAVRAFNGTPVCELPPPRFTGSGVYAIYCTAKKGIYERYGNKVNRMGYNVPIYVGKAVPKGCNIGGTMSFDTLVSEEQLTFWYKEIKSAIELAVADFRYRFYSIDCFGKEYLDGVYRMMLETFHPVWNRVFSVCGSSEEIAVHWKKIHSERFHGKADKASQEELKRFLEVA